ncbi:arsenic resistance protein [Rhodopseudomonas pseudopalustris]|jgi:ACR3 family arsenite efflux pump ArsB|uniref:arsenic resistance protein n=1 Tax=Rhodopseudomonas pseudopalustris TaxID=1513892 RepID=UPI000B898230|nr:arsenic resistance protein [Rhodopseudomonas pseudopalustris]
MLVERVRSWMEANQIAVYFAAIVLGMLAAFSIAGVEKLEWSINPALALMLFVTFLQVPLSDLPKSFLSKRFLLCLLIVNFAIIPLIVAALVMFLPADPMLRLGVLLVLLTPCIDYVVTFTHLGRGDAKSLLAATPLLLIVQMLLLPLYLGVFLGPDASRLVEPEPFLHAFIWLIAVPLALAGIVQARATRSSGIARFSSALNLLPVPATALVLFLVLAIVMPRVGQASAAALAALPIYLIYAVVAPLCGWLAARAGRLGPQATLAVAFSAATRNSLVVLPFAFAVPGGVPLIPAVIVTQTVVELLSELAYVRFLKLLPARNGP